MYLFFSPHFVRRTKHDELMSGNLSATHPARDRFGGKAARRRLCLFLWYVSAFEHKNLNFVIWVTGIRRLFEVECKTGKKYKQNGKLSILSLRVKYETVSGIREWRRKRLICLLFSLMCFGVGGRRNERCWGGLLRTLNLNKLLSSMGH